MQIEPFRLRTRAKRSHEELYMYILFYDKKQYVLMIKYLFGSSAAVTVGSPPRI